ncbi:uncharacterized protein [Rutidosis leptorrhynchoides]|uniref:uncharacterized protein n=1 Tax=Rutidosis leptorrhynchoides TaxID=125765 RepID=UPI003A98ED7A
MTALLQLAYGTVADMFDEYLKMKRYMRSPNAYDVERLYSKHEEKHGFKGMLGSIECMHWEWKNCSVALKQQYTRGDHKKPTIILEAVASLKNGTTPPAPYEVNGNHYTKDYYLADGIYPNWATLVKGYAAPTDDPRIKFTRLAAHTMSVKKMRRVMDCCIILHNMILDQGFALSDWEEDFVTESMENRPEHIPNRGRDQDVIIREIRDRTVHDQLTDDLVEHIWKLLPTFHTTN